MFSGNIEVTFKVQAETKPGESVFVVGNIVELGSWFPQNAKPLWKDGQTGIDEVWSAKISLPLAKEIQYRYFIGHALESENEESERSVIVLFWETNLQPRTIGQSPGKQANSGCDNQTGISQFGNYDGRHKVDKGWLSGQTEIHLRLFNNPINMWKPKYRSQPCRIRCNTVDLRYRDMPGGAEDEESSCEMPTASSANRAQVSILNGADDVPEEQPQFGKPYSEDDYMVFRAQTLDPESFGFQIEFYAGGVRDSMNGLPKFVGSTYILPVNLKSPNWKGQINLPIHGTRNMPIGDLTIEFLIIKPMVGYQCNMQRSFSTHWKQRRPLDVGHRGLGGSFGFNKPISAVRENTLASLSQAGGHGADMVEFDVQLTKDQVPVVYHDFTVCLSLKRRVSEAQEMFEIPVYDLNMAQLQMLKLEHTSVNEQAEPGPSLTDSHCELTDEQPFPTLCQVLEGLDPHLGLNVEIKYCLRLKDQSYESGLRHFTERNKFLDIILKQIMEHGGDRRIVLSCFDPDICSMVRLKQNKYPVIFLTQGKTQKYPEYYDLRTRASDIAIHFSHSQQILGVNFHSEDLLRNDELVGKAKDLGLVVFCWGEANNDKKTISYFKQNGVDGIIYDRIHELKEGSKENIFLMEHKEKMDLLKNVGALPLDTNANNSSTYTAE